MESIDRTFPNLHYNKETVAWLVLIAAALEGSKLVFTPAAIAAMGISLQAWNFMEVIPYLGLPDKFRYNGCCSYVILLVLVMEFLHWTLNEVV
ncbi:hypothetical protein MUK42_34755 [Musa troglodytarum]|uniref:Uncharacterized protein n=1 Tax=Musa troglodytarum TaxID=320322 RepID=A0A9E7KNQ6_9LILI|nr:hypothetical protein MUK42_34755 [Musa troglodytarum]